MPRLSIVSSATRLSKLSLQGIKNMEDVLHTRKLFILSALSLKHVATYVRICF